MLRGLATINTNALIVFSNNDFAPVGSVEELNRYEAIANRII